jgi:hypothetical protein
MDAGASDAQRPRSARFAIGGDGGNGGDGGLGGGGGEAIGHGGEIRGGRVIGGSSDASGFVRGCCECQKCDPSAVSIHGPDCSLGRLSECSGARLEKSVAIEDAQP